MSALDGRVALVTGGASGIGAASAERLATEGATVVVADVDEAAARDLARRLGGTAVALDVREPAAWAAAVDRVAGDHGRLDVVHLNAGVTTKHGAADDTSFAGTFDLLAMTDDEYRHVVGVNVDGVILGARTVLPALVADGGGALVATASMAGLFGWAGDPVYTATKHAVVGFVRAMAPLLEPHAVTVNAVCPGLVDTPLLGRQRDELRAALPLITPAEVADAVLAAATSGRTGEAVVVRTGAPPTRFEFAPVPVAGS